MPSAAVISAYQGQIKRLCISFSTSVPFVFQFLVGVEVGMSIHPCTQIGTLPAIFESKLAAVEKDGIVLLANYAEQ